jgi:RNA ligase (TIGR02306 family)
MTKTSRKLATIDKISSIRPHPNADAIELATVRGWQVVVKKSEFKEGDLCVYCEIDSVLPERPEFEFLRAKHFRIKTVRLRGELSQGIAFPLSVLPKDGLPDVPYLIGTDVTDLLGITLYEPPSSLAIGGDIEGPFPRFLQKTDEERIQNCSWVLDQYRDLDWVATEKLDGTSVSYFWKDGEFGICSPNFKIKTTTKSLYGRLAEKLDLASKLAANGRNIALQGEIVGPKVQGNPYGLKEPQVRFFNLFDIDEGRYEDHSALVRFCLEMDLPRVQVVAFGDVLPATLPQVLKMAEGRSLLNGDNPREGLVFRPILEVRDPQLGRLSFKAISNQWLLGE